LNVGIERGGEFADSNQRLSDRHVGGPNRTHYTPRKSQLDTRRQHKEIDVADASGQRLVGLRQVATALRCTSEPQRQPQIVPKRADKANREENACSAPSKTHLRESIAASSSTCVCVSAPAC
jgi:hypothetical protein